MGIWSFFDRTIEESLARIETSLRQLHTKVDRLTAAPLPPADLTKLWKDVDKLRKLAGLPPDERKKK